MVVATTGSVVSHRHDVAVRAGHGFGWLSFATTASGTNESNPHHHFLIAGIEFGAMPDSGSPEAPAGSRIDPVVKSCVLPNCDFSPDATEECAYVGVVWQHHLPQLDQPSPRLHETIAVCEVARHVRSGVLVL